MRNKIICLLLGAVIVFSPFAICFADGESIKLNEPEIKLGESVTFSGKLTGMIDNPILYTITKDGYAFGDKLSGNLGSGELAAAEDGTFSISIGYDDSTLSSGEYYARFFETNQNLMAEIVFELNSFASLNNILDDVNSQKLGRAPTYDEVLNLLNNNDEKFMFTKNAAYTSITDKTDLAQMLLEELIDDNSITEDTTSFINCVNEITFTLAFNQNRAELVRDKNGFTIDLSYKDAESGMNCFELFSAVMSEKGRNTVISALSGKNYKSVDDWYDDFKIQTFICSIIMPENYGYAHIRKILAENNVEVDTSEYEKLSANEKNKAEYMLVMLSGITTISEFQNKLDEIVASVKNNTDHSGHSGGGSGGGSDGGRTANYTIDSSAYPENSPVEVVPEINSSSFDDLAQYEWAVDAINYFAERKIIQGRGDNKFDPSGYITRAEFVKIIAGVFDVEISDTNSGFADVDSSAWYAPYIAAAKKQGWVSGISDNIFGVSDNITREDCAVILFRIIGMHGNLPKTNFELNFDDSNEISDYAKDAVAGLNILSIINGVGKNIFAPKLNCKRAEAAVMIYKVLEKGL